MGRNLVDEAEIDCGNFFDQIDDLIEFPPDDVCGGGNLVSSGDCKNFPTWEQALQDCDPMFSGGHVDAASDLSAELSVPYEDIMQLEWLSTFMEDSFQCEGLTIGKEKLRVNEDSSGNKFQISSPVSVLESISSSFTFGGKTAPLSPHHRGPQRARSKHPRPPTFNPKPAIQLVPPSSSSESESFFESLPLKKPKKIKIAMPADQCDTHLDPPVRKCLHCEITKTPQWRAGPMGPKTLCNACGVRFKSGRLFPEYRPAASPTFVPSLHSNSHKKVLQMRSKIEPETANTDAKPKPELVPAASPV